MKYLFLNLFRVSLFLLIGSDPVNISIHNNHTTISTTTLEKDLINRINNYIRNISFDSNYKDENGRYKKIRKDEDYEEDFFQYFDEDPDELIDFLDGSLQYVDENIKWITLDRSFLFFLVLLLGGIVIILALYHLVKCFIYVCFPKYKKVSKNSII